MKELIEIAREFEIVLSETASDRERLSASTIICETIANKIIRNLEGKPSESLGASIKHLSYKSKDIESLKYYRDNSNIAFLYTLKNTRNPKQHAFNGPDPIRARMNILSEKPFENDYFIQHLYELIVDFIQQHTKIKIDPNLEHYDHNKPLSLLNFLQITNEGILNNDRNKLQKRYSQKVLYISISSSILITVIFAAIFLRKKELTDLSNSKGEIITTKPAGNKKERSFHSAIEDTSTANQNNSEDLIDIKSPNKQRPTDVQGNQINFGNGNTIENSNISGGDINSNSK